MARICVINQSYVAFNIIGNHSGQLEKHLFRYSSLLSFPSPSNLAKLCLALFVFHQSKLTKSCRQAFCFLFCLMYWLPCCDTTPPMGLLCIMSARLYYMMLPVTKVAFAPSLAHVAAQELYTSHSELKYKETKEQTICLGTVPAVSWLCCVCYSWCLCGNGESRPAHVVRIIL